MNTRTARRAAAAFVIPGAIGAANASPAILTPQANTTVGGRAVTVFARFRAPRPVASVRLFVDGRAIEQRAFRPAGTDGEVTMSWDASLTASGNHTLTLKTYDSAGRVVTVETVPVTVMGGQPAEDRVPPQVAIVTPGPGEKVQGTFDIRVLATDDSGNAPYVSLFVDNELRSVSNHQPYSYPLDTAQYTNGRHVVEAVAYDAAHNKGTANPVAINVNNPGGATTFNEDVNRLAETPALEAPAPTADPVPTVARAPAVKATAPVVMPKVVLQPAAPAPKPQARPAISAKPLVARAFTAPAQAIRKATPAVKAPKPVVPVEAATPRLPAARPTVETPREAAPKPVLVAKALVPKPAPKPHLSPVAAPVPAAKPQEVAPKPQPKPAPVVTVKPEPEPVPAELVAQEDTAPVLVLKMQGDREVQPAPAPRPARAKTLVARALPQVAAGNPARPATHVHPTAPAVHSPAPAPLVRVAKAAPKPAPEMRPAVIPALPADRAEAGHILHAVRPGETPSGIARSYGVPQKRLLASNSLRRTARLSVGRVLRVPSAVRIAVNDVPVQFDVAPRIQNGITVAAFRHVYQAAGGSVQWDSRSRAVRATGGGNDIVLHVGSRTAIVNGSMVTLDAPVRVLNGRVLVPVRFLARALNAKAEYDVPGGSLELRRV